MEIPLAGEWEPAEAGLDHRRGEEEEDEPIGEAGPREIEVLGNLRMVR